MIRTCPSCKSRNARRSTVRASEITWRHIFYSPYRCRDCRERFWVISKNTYYFAGIIGAAVAVGAIAWNVGDWLEGPQSRQAKAATTAPRLADLVKLADNNDAAAEFELYRMYGDGLGVRKNAREEQKWLERSALHGNAQAQYELGIALREGRDRIQDHDAARKWIQLAADGGNGQAQFALGLMYRTGTGIPANNLMAYIWLNIAAAQGVPGAAAARDTVMARLSPAELQEAQAESRRMSAIHIPKPAPAQ